MRIPIAVFAAVLSAGTLSGVELQSQSADLLVPGDEYRKSDLPGHPDGIWWVLHRPAGETVLEPLAVLVRRFHDSCVDEQAHEESGRAVSVPDAERPILLLRTELELSSGPVQTAFVTDGVTGDADSVSAHWNEYPLAVRHVVDGYRYNIEMTVGNRTFALRSDEWQGDGHWAVRWIGDLNRDGWPDVLLDASHKYSVHTTRLFISSTGEGEVTMSEVATFTHTAC